MSDTMVINCGLLQKCRLCLQSSTEFESFFRLYFEDLSLASVFKNITSYEIKEDDALPKNICINCRSTIINFNNMISAFQETELFLRQYLLKKEVNDDIDPNNYDLSDLNLAEEKSDVEDVEDLQENPSETSNDKLVTGIPEVKKRTDFVYQETLSSNGDYRFINSLKYTCECGDCFLYKLGFRHHMQHKHNTIIDENEIDKYSEEIKLKIPTGFSSNVVYATPKLNVRNKLECRVCHSIFSSKEEVKAHEEVHKTHICNHCGAAFLKKAYLQDHQLMHSEDRRYKCKTCGKAFKHRHTLSVHKKTHEDIKSFICEICGTGFRARATLYTHTLLKHTDIKNYPCHSCNLKFNLKSSRDKHFVRKHTFNREKSFVCNHCGLAYLNKTTLTRHIGDKHLGKAKYYPCTLCENKMYVMKKGLRVHMLKKHGISDE